MNMRANDAVDLAVAIKNAAASTEIVLVEATVQSRDDGTGLIVFVSPEVATKIISAHSPRIIYLVEQVFDLSGEIEAARDEIDDIGVEYPLDLLTATQHQYAPYDGQIAATVASFMIDGVLHTALATADWNDDFDDAVATILDDAREGASANQFIKHTEEGKAIERKALVLVKHPSFNHGRVSFDKRMALAGTLFEDCDARTLTEITRRAENLFWLEQSGVKLDGT